MKVMNIVQKCALVFTIIGGIVLGLIGIFNYNLIAAILGDMTVAARIFYSLIGIASLINIMLFFVDLDEKV